MTPGRPKPSPRCWRTWRPGALAHGVLLLPHLEEQEALHQNKVNRLLSQGYSPASAEEEASRWVVPAGTSEHQLGLAADIVAADYQVLEEEQENTPEQQWLMAHCQEYGFILRYPKDKTEVTGVGYEPGTTAMWAWRPPRKSWPRGFAWRNIWDSEKGLLRPDRAGRPYTRPEQWGA